MTASVGWVSSLVLSLALSGCGLWPATEVDVVGAVDHVGEVVRDAGVDPPRVAGLVSIDCGPTDAVLGIRVTDAPVTVAVPWDDVAPVVAATGRDLGEAAEDPAAGMPAHVDRVEVVRDGWTVRWGESNASVLDDGAHATVVTVVGGGEVAFEDLQRWEDTGVVTEAGRCG